MVTAEQPAPRGVAVGPAVDGTVVAVLSGSLDLTDVALVRDRLRPPGRWPRALTLDLAAVDFFDCAMLSALIAVRGEARREGCQVVISAASPAVRLLLRATGTAASFGYPPGSADGQGAESSAGESRG